jgi:hypothetical protein
LVRGRSRIAIPIPVWETDNTRDGGYLTSAFDSEGSISQYSKARTEGLILKYTQTNLDIQNEVERILSFFGFDYSRFCLSNMPSSRYSPGVEAWGYQIKGGFAENLRFLGQLRPVRLLSKFDIEKCSRRMFSKLSRSRLVVGKDFLGDWEVIALGTDTGTYFAEGMPSHNTAVDIVKLMMLYLRRLLVPQIRLLLQVHDEILWECPDQLLKEAVEQCQELRQAFPDYPVNITVGSRYSELKEVSDEV